MTRRFRCDILLSSVTFKPANYAHWFNQAIERRKAEHPDRPLIRISSTFFWHLSSDYDLAPIPALQERARALRVDAINLGKIDLEEETVYEPMKVGQQVIKYVLLLQLLENPRSEAPDSELKHIALMA